jgi:lipopolysaccharide export system protein LptA
LVLLPLPLTVRPLAILSVVAMVLTLGRAVAQVSQGSTEGASLQTPPTSPPASNASNGLVTIEADRQQADNRTGIVTALGNVRIVYPDRKMVATSRQAQYFSKEGRLVLSGDVDVIDADGQRIRAERLTYRLDSERVQADPAQGTQVISNLKLKPQQSSGAAVAPLVP